MTGSSHNPAVYTSPTQHHQHHSSRGSATSPLKPSLRSPTPSSRDPPRDYPAYPSLPIVPMPPVTQSFSQYSPLLVTTSHNTLVVTTSPNTTISRGTSPIHVTTPSGALYRRNSIEQCTTAVQTCFSPEPDPLRRPETKDICIQTLKLHLEPDHGSKETAHVQCKDEVEVVDEKEEEVDICDNNDMRLCSADSDSASDKAKCTKTGLAASDDSVKEMPKHSKGSLTDAEHPIDLRTKQSDQDSIVKSETNVQNVSLEPGALSESESVHDLTNNDSDIPEIKPVDSYSRGSSNGLELLSFLAEQRSIEFKEEQRLQKIQSSYPSDIKVDINRNYSSISRVLTSPRLVSPTLTSPKIPRTLSTRNDRSDDENCYYMSGGVRLKDGM